MLTLGLVHGMLIHVNHQHVFHLCPSIDESNRERLDRHPPKKIYNPSMPADAATVVEEVYRSDWGRIVATLIGLVGDFDLAEESAQEAFAAAVDQWTDAGVPEFPRAWIIQ